MESKKIKQKLHFLTIAFIAIFLFNSCEKGDQGRSYIRIVNELSATSYTYTDNNSDVPNNFTFGQYYETSAGSFTYYYQWWSGAGTSYCSTSFGTGTYKYTISLETGKDWDALTQGVLTKGVSGKDRYYTFHMSAGSCGVCNYTYKTLKPVPEFYGILIDGKTIPFKQEVKHN